MSDPQSRSRHLFRVCKLLRTIFGGFSIIYFSGLELRIRVIVWVMVMVIRVRVRVRVLVRVGVVLWSE